MRLRYLEFDKSTGFGDCTSNQSSGIQQELHSLGITINTPSGCLPNWLQGMGSVHVPFNMRRPELVSPAEKASYLYEIREVPILTPSELLHSLNISSVKILKIDAEGEDEAIVGSFVKH